MKKIFFIFFILSILFFVIGCDILPFYTVSFIDEGIITQGGDIIGVAKEPGLHFKIPIIQKVHMVNVHQVRFLSVPIDKKETPEVQVLWHVKDSKKFFKASNSTGDDKKIELLVAPIYKGIIEDFISNGLIAPVQGQKDNIDINIDAFKQLKSLIQKSSLDYGLNIVDVQFKKR